MWMSLQDGLGVLPVNGHLNAVHDTGFRENKWASRHAADARTLDR